MQQIATLCHKFKRKGKAIYPSEQRRTEALCRIPIGDVELDKAFRDRRASHTSAAAYTLCNRAFEFLAGYKFLHLTELTEAITAWENDEAIVLPCRYRNRVCRMKDERIFMTREGFVGMGPACMRTGDLVVVLNRTDLPSVVRKEKSSSNKFLLLGECYCDGIVDGETVDRGEEEDFYFV